VGIVGPTYPLRGGQALLLGHVHEALERRGLETRVITFARLYPRLLFPGKREDNASARPVKAIPSEALLTPTDPRTWRRALRALEDGPGGAPRMLLMTWWNPFFGPMFRAIARGARRRFGAPTLMICENVVSHEGRVIDGLLTRIGLAEPAEFIVLSEAVREQLRRYRPDAPLHRSRLPVYDCYGAPPGRAEARAQLGIAEDKVVLFFGLVRAYKGLDLLIDAFARAAPRVAGMRLLVVGEFYEGERERREQIEELGIAQSTTVVADYVPDERVARYFGAADCVVLPYRSATQSGITQVALGMGVPMIATAVGGLPEVVRPGVNGVLVPPDDAQALGDALVRFFEEEQGVGLRRRMEEARGSGERAEDEIAGVVAGFLGAR